MTSRTLIAALVAAVLGCATSSPKVAPAAAPRAAERAEKAGAARAAPSAEAPVAEGISARAQRLFEEAVSADEEQKKLKVPTDWPYLERKWRAVLDAEEVPEARYDLGVALDAQGRLAEARAEYERARQEKPSLRQAAVNLGVLLERQGDVRAAQAVYAEVVRDSPEDAVSRERLATLYRSAGQLDEAWRLAREALMRDPRSVPAHKVLVQVAAQRNELDLAMLVARRAQKLDPADPELPFLAGQVLAKQGDEAGAGVQYRKALALRESFLPARYALFKAALEKQSWPGVAEHARALLEKDPGNAQLQLALGIALRHTGKPDDALAAYAQAEKLGGEKLPEVHLARGVLYARVKSECEPAISELKAYQQAVGPVFPESSQVVKIQRECEQLLDENRRALEAAKAMQAEAQKQAEKKQAEGKQGDATPPTATPGPGAPAPTSAPAPGK